MFGKQIKWIIKKFILNIIKLIYIKSLKLILFKEKKKEIYKLKFIKKNKKLGWHKANPEKKIKKFFSLSMCFEQVLYINVFPSAYYLYVSYKSAL